MRLYRCVVLPEGQGISSSCTTK